MSIDCNKSDSKEVTHAMRERVRERRMQHQRQTAKRGGTSRISYTTTLSLALDAVANTFDLTLCRHHTPHTLS